jgi:hypothetical protein
LVSFPAFVDSNQKIYVCAGRSILHGGIASRVDDSRSLNDIQAAAKTFLYRCVSSAGKAAECQTEAGDELLGRFRGAKKLPHR